MQIMTAKGLVTRSETQRAHVYVAGEPAEKTKQQFAADVMQRVFQGLRQRTDAPRTRRTP